MSIQLSPKLEEIVREDASTAGYANVDDYLEDVLTAQHPQLRWRDGAEKELEAMLASSFASEGAGTDRTPEQAREGIHARIRQHFAERNVA